MIKLFELSKGSYNLEDYNHVLHGDIVTQFEEEFAKYVGCEYACVVDSCTNAIFLTVTYGVDRNIAINIPSMIPPVVVNAVYHSNHKIRYTDDINWVGGSYNLYTSTKGSIIDSAHRVDRDQYKNEHKCDKDIMLFSFYPTKVVHGIDGGMICTNSKEIYDYYKCLTTNGMSEGHNSWTQSNLMHGWKMYMSSIQAHVALKSLRTLDDRKEMLSVIRDVYNEELGYNSTSDHLYRIYVDDNSRFIAHMREHDIVCGIHYKSQCREEDVTPLSIENEAHVVSIPFHSEMDHEDMSVVLSTMESYKGEIYDEVSAQYRMWP